ncbi:MAG: helix-turn-helix domain-containing protein [Isosphaeraceae bacterium]|nr:helix-turn-helix domain-containing protein [Isosphaeraceae bacterium]
MNTTCPAVNAKLTQFQLRVLEFFERNQHKLQGVCQATKTLATKFGVSISYIQKTLKRLRELGLISRVWDYALRTRRRFFLGEPPEPPLFADQTDVEPPAVNGLLSVQSTDSCPSRNELPPDPPIEVPGGEFKGEAIGDGPTSPSPTPSISTATETRKATPQEIREAISKAAPVLRVDEASARKRIVALARQWGLSWVVAAIDRAAEKQATEPLRNPVGYVVRTLEGFAAEGGPTISSPPPPPVSIMEQIRQYEAEQEAFIASLG